MKPKVACLGGAVIDFIYTLPALPKGDTKVSASSYTAIGGGMAANAAVAIARLGGDSHWYGLVGDDALAAQIIDGLEHESVATHPKVIGDSKSAHSIVLCGEKGSRTIVLYRPEQLCQKISVSSEWSFASYNALLVDNRWIQGAIEACRAARRNGIPAVVDADLSDDPAVVDIYKEASHVIFSWPALHKLTEADDVCQALKMAKRMAPFVAVTMGEEGVAWLDDQGEFHTIPSIHCEAVETNGAGDVFHGAFALALAEGKNEEDSIIFAAHYAALKCERMGARLTYPTRIETEEFIQSRT